jgi:integrase
LLGFAGAFRRSELVALDVTDLEFCEGGLRVHVRRSKTDQEGAGDTIAIALGSVACPVKAVRAWLDASKIASGPLFRRIGKGDRIGIERLADHTVVRVVKASARRVGLDPKLFAGHSLRSGFLTSAAGRGASIFKMMDQSRHKSMDTLRGYVRDARTLPRSRGRRAIVRVPAARVAVRRRGKSRSPRPRLDDPDQSAPTVIPGPKTEDGNAESASRSPP